jgi:nucleotide-binding universal stress UspA family protein
MKFPENSTIVIPFDFSGPATQAVERALEMADQSCGLYLIHVIHPVPSVISMDPAMPFPPAGEQDRADKAMARLKELFGSGKYARLRCQTVIGDPGTEIADMAKNVQADLIVMPTHGRTGLKRLFLGSVAERVLRLAECPVLVLRDKT